MKKKILFLSLITLLLGSCTSYDIQEETKKQVSENVKKVFGVEFDKNHDWCLTNSGTITVNNIPSSVDMVQLLAYTNENDSATSLTVLNAEKVNGQSTIKLAYDAPNDNLGLYVAFISDNDFALEKVDGNSVALTRAVKTRAAENYEFPTETPVITEAVESYASSRGWLSGEKLYGYGEYVRETSDYNDYFKSTLRAFIFSYFKNGRNYNNLPLVKESGAYNDNSYPITTGNKPIIVSPIYKCDRAELYGNEVYNSDLYYYYFKEKDMEGKDPIAFLQALPKYKAIAFNNHFGSTEDDKISKRNSFILAYFGDGTPSVGTEGTYQFPAGYKIGFMVRAKTEFESPKKQGELYGDGRLNKKINAWPNFKSSKLGNEDPRLAWLTINGKTLMCWESGTDSDFNDIILEVEGGIKPIIIIPDIDCGYYTFCFEDRELGDYDMNDVVLRGERISSTQVRYTLVACGAFDKLKIKNINGAIINDSKEIHELFGVEGGYVNTVNGQEVKDYVVDVITVDKDFSFLDEATQPYIYDITTNTTVKISRVGEDPHGIMIPYEFKYPLEKVCIKNAYEEFNNWGVNKVESTDWYTKPILKNVWNK